MTQGNGPKDSGTLARRRHPGRGAVPMAVPVAGHPVAHPSVPIERHRLPPRPGSARAMRPYATAYGARLARGWGEASQHPLREPAGPSLVTLAAPPPRAEPPLHGPHSGPRASRPAPHLRVQATAARGQGAPHPDGGSFVKNQNVYKGYKGGQALARRTGRERAAPSRAQKSQTAEPRPSNRVCVGGRLTAGTTVTVQGGASQNLFLSTSVVVKARTALLRGLGVGEQGQDR